MRVLKVSDDMSGLLQNVHQTRQAVDSYATILTCLVEFNSIEHSLALQDEDDRQNM